MSYTNWIVLCDSKMPINLDHVRYIKPWSNTPSGERVPIEGGGAYLSMGDPNYVKVTQDELDQIVDALDLVPELFGGTS